MASKKIVLKVDLSREKQRKKAFAAISSLPGVDSISISMDKITVTGLVDPVYLINKLRRLFLTAQIFSVGPAKEEKKHGSVPLLPPQLYAGPREFRLDFLIRITNNFSKERIIGRNRHGTIYKGLLDNGEYIAVNKLHLNPGLQEKEFKSVVNDLMRIQHQNAIRLIGYCHHTVQLALVRHGELVSAKVEERALCFEYVPVRSLNQHLSNDEPCELPWYICYKIIKGICEGLHYIHEELENPIYHLGLKPTNILLDRDMIPKIQDFGLRLLDLLETDNMSEDMETSVYVPPEYINKHQISRKFDVFSLGVTIIQIMAGKESYSKCADTPPEEFIQFVHELWAKKIPETSWRYTSHEVRACIEVALNCVKSDPVMRPTITEIVDKLNKINIADCSSIDQLYRTREFTLKFLKHITKDFAKQNIVGHGGYGVIYKGVLDNGEEVAVKKLRQNLLIDDEQFNNELNNLMRVQHKNIVRLVGYCNHTEQTFVEYNGKLVAASVEQKALCLEYLQGGSLDRHLSDGACRLDWGTCYKIIKGICEGLHYLHNGSDHPIIYHLDLKPSNILLDKDMTPKIGDFGLSKLFDSVQTYWTQSEYVKGTLGYMPPEYINGQSVSPKFDVFSLGVMIIQMMAGKQGYFDCADTPPKKNYQACMWKLAKEAAGNKNVVPCISGSEDMYRNGVKMCEGRPSAKAYYNRDC